MRLKSVSLLLCHYEAGNHREIAAWHEEIHRPEMHEQVPSFFFSQDWVAPADYVNLRPANALSAQGGEYALVYLSDTDASTMNGQTRLFAAEEVRKNKPHPYQEVVWRARMDLVEAHARPNLQVELGALPLAPNSGLAIFIEEVTDDTREADYERWLHDVHLPAILTDDLLAGCLELQPFAEDMRNVRVRAGFADQPDSHKALAAVLRQTEQQRAAAGDLTRARRPIFSGVYRPIVTRSYDDYE
jgi:hypothetical protein